MFVLGLILMWLAYYFRQGMRGDAAKSMSEAIGEKVVPKVEVATDRVIEHTPKPVKVVLGAAAVTIYVVWTLVCFFIAAIIAGFFLGFGF